MNNITIAGNIGKDAEVRSTPNGDRVAGWSVAVNEGKDRTTWFSCSLWGDRAEKLAPFIRKGDRIAVSGSVSARAHDGKAYLEVRVSQVTFLSSKREDYRPGLDDEIPF